MEWLRLVSNRNPALENRAHFFSAAAEAMRRILIDRARRKLSVRHGGGLERVDLDGQDYRCFVAAARNQPAMTGLDHPPGGVTDSTSAGPQVFASYSYNGVPALSTGSTIRQASST